MFLKGKKALITGGSRGIGKAIVIAFLKEGADVYSISTKPSPFQDEINNTANESGTKVFWKKGNVADEQDISAVVNEILAESGGLDILVNNAGITRDGLIFRMTGSDWDEVIKTNLSSAFYISKIISRDMIKKRTGSIVNMSSVVGLIGNAGQANYSASKAGLIGLTKSMAREVASRNVRVNAIAPGFIETDMTGNLNDKQQEELKTVIPMKRTGTPEDVANAALFLASDLSLYITGQVIQVTGGMGM